jgi:MbtH protein
LNAYAGSLKVGELIATTGSSLPKQHDPAYFPHLSMYSTKGDATMTDNKDDSRIFKVVVNHEDQYSIWPANRDNPVGWESTRKSGTKEECLAYIKEVWTDMRPLSLRNKMDRKASAGA